MADEQSSENFEPTEDAEKLYREFWAETNKRQLSSSENYDKSILTYSSAGLAISLTFLKDFVRYEYIVCETALYLSWFLFVASIAITVASFLVSYYSQSVALDYADKYLLQGIEEYRTKKSLYEKIVSVLNILSGASFVISLILTTVFVVSNFEKGIQMSGKVKNTFAQDGMPPALIQRNRLSQEGLGVANIPKTSQSNTQTSTDKNQTSANQNKK